MGEFDELVQIMKRLREPGGCPWDREQNHESLKPYLIEEAYEVLDAIDRMDDGALKEELGDLMLQIVFHARLAEEDKRFSIADVLTSIVHKLKRRHPHVFGEVSVSGADEVLRNWEQIKKKEGKASVLSGVPEGLPALLRARRVQEKARRAGFDWNSAQGALEKVCEEVKELKEAVEKGERFRIEEEFGDLLFSLVNVSRFLGIDAEDTLRKTIVRFTGRFQQMEKMIAEKGERSMTDYTVEELDSFWEEAKHE